MSLELDNEFGRIIVSDLSIASIAGAAALECYGVVGMASRNQLMDGISELLGHNNLSRGIEVRQEHDQLTIDIYIIVSYGTRISEVAHNIQTKVKYVLNEVVGLEVDVIHVIVQSVRVST